MAEPEPRRAAPASPPTKTRPAKKRRAKKVPARPLRKKRRASVAPPAPAPSRKKKRGKKLPVRAAKKSVRKKKRVAARPAAPRKKKKVSAGKKLVRRKKKKKVSRFAPVVFRSPFTGEETTVAIVPPPPPVISRAAPMPIAQASQVVGHAMRDFVMARLAVERIDTGRSFHGLKTAFRQTYGEQAWRDAFDWIVDEWGLDDYIFDREALRDS